ncbi:MAG: hypothetical protein HQ557_06075 [Bacteroidetes bacterium]|nr:hypothetical protein [Bacteroidota bacterium]
MLLLDKHTDPCLSIINISSLIVECILEDDVVEYDVLLSTVISKTSEKVKSIFIYAISFLYSIQKIEYLKETDCFRLLK